MFLVHLFKCTIWNLSIHHSILVNSYLTIVSIHWFDLWISRSWVYLITTQICYHFCYIWWRLNWTLWFSGTIFLFKHSFLHFHLFLHSHLLNCKIRIICLSACINHFDYSFLFWVSIRFSCGWGCSSFYYCLLLFFSLLNFLCFF